MNKQMNILNIIIDMYLYIFLFRIVCFIKQLDVTIHKTNSLNHLHFTLFSGLVLIALEMILVQMCIYKTTSIEINDKTRNLSTVRELIR